MYCERVSFLLYAFLASVSTVKLDEDRNRGLTGVAKEGEFPSQAILYNRHDGKWEQSCSGFLIKPRFVLTAAHCISAQKPEELRVILGQLQRNFYNKTATSVLVNVKQIIIPDEYGKTRSRLGSDLGLLELTKPVPESDNVKPAEVDWENKVNLRSGRILTSPLWKTDENSSPELHWTKMKLLMPRMCLKEIDRHYTRQLTEDRVCSVGINGTALYRLNSGGAATVRDGRHHYVVGIYIGIMKPTTSQEKYINLMTNITNPVHRTWLQKHLGELDSRTK